MSIIKAISKKLFGWAGYQGVIDTQISIYNRLKKQAPDMSENERLNYIITSRMRAIPKVGSDEDKEYQEYKDQEMVKDNRKTLEDVIWAIVGYEFIQSRRVELFSRGYKIGLSTEDIGKKIAKLQEQIESDIKESIRKKVKQ